MMFGRDRNELRRMYTDAWHKSEKGLVLSPLEAQIVTVIEEHPEYVPAVVTPNLDEDFQPTGGQTNPFLHLGLHLALRDQVATDRPTGIRTAFDALETRTGDRHNAEHRAIECLAETLWEAQRDNAPPDEQAYLERIRRL